MTKQQRMRLQDYASLLNDFISGRITPKTFETIYLRKFKAETIELPEHAFEVLDRLFGDVDAYCDDPSIRDSDDLGDEELLSSAKRSLGEIEKII